MKKFCLGMASLLLAMVLLSGQASAQQHQPKLLSVLCRLKAGGSWNPNWRQFMGGDQKVFRACLAGRDGATPLPGVHVPTCREVFDRCVARSPQWSSGCDAYYQEARRTGKWPAFGTQRAFVCR